MSDLFSDVNWDSFGVGLIIEAAFFVLGIIVAIRLIPSITVRQLSKKNKKTVIKKISSLVQEISFFVNKSPFKQEIYSRGSISVATKKDDIWNHKFVALVSINLFDPRVLPEMKLAVLNKFQSITPDDGLQLIEQESERLKEFRLILETIISSHGHFVDDDVILSVSELCLDIRSLEIAIDGNYGYEDLIEKGLTEQRAISGVIELADLYEGILKLLHRLLDKRLFDIKVEN